MSEMLEKARKYEREESAKIEKENRPVNNSVSIPLKFSSQQ